jgi:hypothetical protein
MVCVSSGLTPAANTNYEKELPEKWKESFDVHIKYNGYTGFCSD